MKIWSFLSPVALRFETLRHLRGTTTARSRGVAFPIGIVAIVLLAAWPVLSIAHEALIVVAAALLRTITTLPALHELVAMLPTDPIYSAAALETIGKIETGGVAVAAPFGSFLHDALPGLFAPAELAHGAWAAAVIWSGSTVLSQSLAAFSSNVALAIAGAAMIRLARRRGLALRAITLAPVKLLLVAALGLELHGHVAHRILAHPPLPIDLEAMGISFAVGVLFPSITGRQMAISDLQASVSGSFISLAFALLGLLIVFAVALLVLVVVAKAAPLRRVSRLRIGRARARRPILQYAAIALVFIMAGGAVAAYSRQSAASLGAVAAKNVEAQSAPATAPADLPPSDLSPRAIAEGTASSPASSADRRPSRVVIYGQQYSFVYVVNGEPVGIRGMGYNPIYAGLDQGERLARYDRDFTQMREAGVNTVFGWTNAEFDGLVLDKAQEHRLGVALPYHLEPTLDYGSAAVQEQVMRDVLQWVRAYKDHPALRMWSVGNEVLHKIVYPSWLPLKKNAATNIERARAFAKFYVTLIDLVHEADPTHPVVLRDAEDAYVGWIRDAAQATGVSRNWFIYGVNVYTTRLKVLLANWSKHGMDIPLIVSEFAPAGVGPKDRPEGYRQMWQVIRRHRDFTIGGVPYVWTTAGPEEVDRAFGLVDAAGRPVDGSLGAITSMFSAEEELSRTAP